MHNRIRRFFKNYLIAKSIFLFTFASNRYPTYATRVRMPSLDYQEHRDREFCQTFFQILNLCGGIMCDYIYQAAINSQASRFYIGEAKAIANLLLLRKGRKITLCPVKQKMYIDLYKKTCEIFNAGGVSFSEAVRQAIRTPAPQFYISVRTARHIISTRRKYSRNPNQKQPAQ